MERNKLIENNNMKEILGQYGIPESTATKLIRDTDYNAVYLVDGDSPRILRVSKRLNEGDIYFELDVLRYLSQNSFPTAIWYPTKENQPFAKTSDGRIGTLFEYIKGDHVEISPREKPDKTLVHEAGKTLGNLHSLTIDYSPEHVRSRNIYTEFDRVLKNRDQFSAYFEGGEDFVEQVQQMVDFTKGQQAKSGVINNDYRVGNVFYSTDGKVIAVIDFDWACVGPLVKDLALGLVEWSFPDGASKPWQDLFAEFLKGYNENSPEKWKLNDNLRSWIMFACLSDASTYLTDLMKDPNNTKKSLRSFMYNKYLFFKKIKL